MIALLSVLVSAALLLWPAVLNGYPLVFGDSGVYLSDGIDGHVSWPRPPFYGLFMLALHWKTTLWPVVAAQAVIAASLLHLVIRTMVPGLSALWLVPVSAVLAACTALPWFAAQLMPDLFGALMLLALALLILVPERLSWPMKAVLVLFGAGCIAMHQSYLPTSIAVLAVLLCFRGRDVRWADVVRGLAVPLLAIVAATTVNAKMTGQASPSPYGKIFVLTRIIFDGPGQRALRRECPRPDWSLCAQADAIPPTVEQFLFGDLYGRDSTLERAGGYRAVAAQAMPIIASALQAEPGAMLLGAVRNSARQFVSFASGDWLIVPMPSVTATWERYLPPAEAARFKAGKQQRLIELLPDWLQAIHQGVGFLSLLVLSAGLIATWSADRVLAGLYAAILTGLVANAVVTGALSGVYDRYQSRFMWLPVFAAMVMLLAWGYSPRQRGGRLARNASIPSRKSALS